MHENRGGAFGFGQMSYWCHILSNPFSQIFGKTITAGTAMKNQ